MARTKNKEKIICEECSKEEATSISLLGAHGTPQVWRLTGMCTSGIEQYYVTFDRLEELWVPHLKEKNWFSATRHSFYRCWDIARKSQRLPKEYPTEY